MLGGFALHATRPTAPAFDAVRAAHGPSDVRLIDRHGVVLASRRIDPVRRRLDWVALADVSPALTAAVIAAEDRRFVRHGGVDLRALLRRCAPGGARRDATGRQHHHHAGGGAARPRAAAARQAAGRSAQKWRQMRAARALERAWSKDQILEAYLNLVDVRGDLSGVGAAASALFGATPARLDAAESTVLAALVAAPSATPRAVERRAAALRERLPDAPPAAAVTAATRRALAHRAGLPAPPEPGAARRATPAHRPARRADHARRRCAARRHRRRCVAPCWPSATAACGTARSSSSTRRAATCSRTSAAAARCRARPTSTACVRAGRRARRSSRSSTALALERAPSHAGVAVRGRAARDRARARALSARELRRPVPRPGLASALRWRRRSTCLPCGRWDWWARDAFRRSAARARFRRPARGAGDSTARRSRSAPPTSASGSWSARTARWPPADAPAPLRLTPDASAAEPSACCRPTRRLSRRRHARRPRRRSATFGLENPLATRFWTRRQDGHQQGHARQLVRRLLAPLHGRRLGRQLLRRADARRQRRHRRRAGVARDRWTGSTARRRASRLGRLPGSSPPRCRSPATSSRRAPSGRSPAPRIPAPALASGAPRIRTPVAGSRLALDPDIPRERQRLRLDAAGAAAGMRWRVDGADVGAADTARLWAPHAGSPHDRAGRRSRRGARSGRDRRTRGCGRRAPSTLSQLARPPDTRPPGRAPRPDVSARRHRGTRATRRRSPRARGRRTGSCPPRAPTCGSARGTRDGDVRRRRRPAHRRTPALVAQRVELARHDERGRQAGRDRARAAATPWGAAGRQDRRSDPRTTASAPS